MSNGLNSISAFDAVLEKALQGQPLDYTDAERLLATPPGDPLERLFATARALRERAFGDQIFLYGFVYFSTYCQNHCHFCLYRQCNPSALRYRMSIEATLDVARELEDAGVHLIDLTMGEDPYFLNQEGERLLELVLRCREAINLPIMVSPGVLNAELLTAMAGQKIDWYACYQETFNQKRFIHLREGQNFSQRLEAKVQARRAGLLIEEGLLLGVGESRADVLLALRYMEALGTSQVRAMTFRPQPQTPMDSWQVPDALNELRTIATFRLCFPDRLIPASLDVDGLQGLKDRLNAGANVVTSVIPPRHNLAGVAQARFNIEDGQRSVSAVDRLIGHLGLRIAPLSAYRDWLRREKRRAGRPNNLAQSSEDHGGGHSQSLNRVFTFYHKEVSL